MNHVWHIWLRGYAGDFRRVSLPEGESPRLGPFEAVGWVEKPEKRVQPLSEAYALAMTRGDNT